MPPPDECGETPWAAQEREREEAERRVDMEIGRTLARVHDARLAEQAYILRRCGFSTAELVIVYDPCAFTVEIVPRMAFTERGGT